MSPFRRTRVLLALGPIAGVLGALVGAGFRLGGPSSLLELRLPELGMLGIVSSFLASLFTLVAAGAGRERGRPFHALKAGAVTAAVMMFPGMLLGELIASMGV